MPKFSVGDIVVGTLPIDHQTHGKIARVADIHGKIARVVNVREMDVIVEWVFGWRWFCAVEHLALAWEYVDGKGWYWRGPIELRPALPDGTLVGSEVFGARAEKDEGGLTVLLCNGGASWNRGDGAYEMCVFDPRYDPLTNTLRAITATLSAKTAGEIDELKAEVDRLAAIRDNMAAIRNGEPAADAEPEMTRSQLDALERLLDALLPLEEKLEDLACAYPDVDVAAFGEHMQRALQQFVDAESAKRSKSSRITNNLTGNFGG